MSSLPYAKISNVFNPADFTSAEGSITFEEADKRYIRYGGNATVASIDSAVYKQSGTILSFDVISGITPGGALASKALVLNSEKDISGIRYMSMDGLMCSTYCNAPAITMDNMTLNGQFVQNVLAFDNSFSATLGLGSSSSNNIIWYGGTAFKERIFITRASDNEGLLIGTKQSTTQRLTPLLRLYAGYDQTGVIGTANSGYYEVIRANDKLQGFSTNYQTGWFNGYLLGTQAWGGTSATQFYSNTGAINIQSNSSSTSSFVSGGNFLILSDGRACLNTTTPISGFQMTLAGTSTYNGISLTGSNDMIRLQNFNSSSTSNTNLLFIGDIVNWQVGTGNSSATAPNSFFAYGNGAYRLRVSSSGQLGVNTTSTGAGMTVNSASNVVMGRFIDNTNSNYLDIYCNAGTFGNRIFLGPSTASGLTFKTNDSPRMTIDVNGWIGVGTESPVYPFQVNNTRGGQEGSQNYYYYLGPGATNGSITTTPSAVSIRSYGRILVSTEVDVLSDRRKKDNIELLDNDYCMKFINNVPTKKFNYKSDPNGTHYGYIAQDLIKLGFGELIMVELDLLAKPDVDFDGFKSEAGKTYSLSKNQIIAILHNALKQNIDEVANLKKIVMEMRYNK